MPILLGPIQRIKRMKDSLGLDFECEIYDPRNDARRKEFIRKQCSKIEARKGMTLVDADSIDEIKGIFRKPNA